MVDKKDEAKKRRLMIDTMVEMPLEEVSASATPTGKKDANCIVSL